MPRTQLPSALLARLFGLSPGGPVNTNPLVQGLAGNGSPPNLSAMYRQRGAINTNPFLQGLVGSGGAGAPYGTQKFGLNDFGLTPHGPDSSTTVNKAPNVAGASKHPTNLQQAALAAITGQYAPVLGALADEAGQLRGQAGRDRRYTRRQGNRAEGDLATLYSRLRQYAGNTQNAQDADYRHGVRETNRNFNSLRRGISKDLAASGGGVASELTRMGIDPSVALAGAARDAAFNRGLANTDRVSQVSNSRASRREYDAGMGRMKNDIIATGNAAIGTQRTQTRAALQDIAKQLSSGLMQVNMQRAQTLGQRAAALGQLKLSQIQAKQAANNPTSVIDMLMKRAQLAKILAETKNIGQPSSSSASTKVPTGMAAAINYIQGLPQFQGGANWGGLKGNELIKLLENTQAQGSQAIPPQGMAPWDPKQYGDVLKYLTTQLTGAKGPRGGLLYNKADQTAAQNALMIALGMLK